jgi:hypothetical protein
VWDTVVDNLMVSPARSEWRRSYVGPGGFIPPGARMEPTGEIMCLVEIPAVYQRAERQVMVRPGRSYEVVDPPVTRTVERQVIDQPGRVIERRIPAVYRIERASRMVTPERVDVIEVPAVMRDVTRQRMVDAGHDDWREIDCPAAPVAGPPPGPRLRRAPPPPQAAPPSGETRGIPPRMRDGERG